MNTLLQRETPKNEYDIPAIGETLMLLVGHSQHIFIKAKNILVEMFHSGANIIFATGAGPYLKYISQARELDGFLQWLRLELIWTGAPASDKTDDILKRIQGVVDASLVFQDWLDRDLGVPSVEKTKVMAELRQNFIELGVGRAIRLKWQDDSVKSARRVEAKQRAKLKSGR